MKKLLIFSGLVVFLGLSLLSCKAMARTAAKYWTKKQIKEFVANCEEKSSRFISAEKAAQYCDCAVDKVAEKYQDYKEVTQQSIIEVLKIANDCRD